MASWAISPRVAARRKRQGYALASEALGGDLEAFMLHSVPRALFKDSQLVLVAGEPDLHRLAGNMPDGTIVGARGTHGVFAPDSPLGKRFEQAANGLRGYKRELYEGGLRNAGLIRWPGTVPAGRVSDEPWAFWDFLPTAAELAALEISAL